MGLPRPKATEQALAKAIREVAKVSFTVGEAAVEKIAVGVSRNLASTLLELGGKSARRRQSEQCN